MNEWLITLIDTEVKVYRGIFVYEGILRWNGHLHFMVKFCEFTTENISSYGFDQNGQPYVILIK